MFEGVLKDRSALPHYENVISPHYPRKGGHAHISAKALSDQRSQPRLVNTSRLLLTEGHSADYMA